MQLYTSNSEDSLRIVLKSKSDFRIFQAAMLLFYIVQKLPE
jgi:hypothetical protein